MAVRNRVCLYVFTRLEGIDDRPIDLLDRETAHAVVMALQGLRPDDRSYNTDAFRRQLGYRLEQARLRANR